MKQKLLHTLAFLFPIGSLKQNANRIIAFSPRLFNRLVEIKWLFLIFFCMAGTFTTVYGGNRYWVTAGDWNSKSVWPDESVGQPGTSASVLGGNIFIARDYKVMVASDATGAALNHTEGFNYAIGILELGQSGTWAEVNSTAANIDSAFFGSSVLTAVACGYSVSYSSTQFVCKKTDTADIQITINGGISPYRFTINPKTTNKNLTPKSFVNGIATFAISPIYYPNFTITIRDGSGCSIEAAINVKDNTPPNIDAITQPTCDLATGSVVLKDLPTAGWKIIPDNDESKAVSGSGTTANISGLIAGPHSFTVTNTMGCVSDASTEITIDNQPILADSPVLNDTNLGCNRTSFVQDWAAVPNAVGYQLDVASDVDFTNYVPGFQNKVLGNVTFETITGLSSTGTYYVRLRTVSVCGISPDSNTVTVTTPTTTYNGVWSNGLPDSDKKIIFDNIAYSLPSDMNACSCQVNATAAIIVPEGLTLKVENELTVVGTGKLTFENNASLVQVNDAAINTGAIVYKRISQPMNISDYTFWSSPVSGQTLKALSPNTESDKFYSWGTTYWTAELPSKVMYPPGRGYIFRTPKPGVYRLPYPETVVMPYSQPVQFVGVPNNGHYDLPVNTVGQQNVIGNPYPSALSADAFLTANASLLNGTLYFWTHNTRISSAGQYTSADYAPYNFTGGVATAKPAPNSGINNTAPTGNIAAGQSFMVSSSQLGVVIFDNSMRVGSGGAVLDNSNFFRTSQSKTQALEKHRVWLNLTNAGGVFKQMLVGYITGATLGNDSGFDGASMNANSFVDFYSVNENKNFTIQGRPLPFDVQDKVALGYKTTIDGVFEISIDKTDGLLADHPIYLEDKTTNTIHNLKNGPYSFSALKGTFNERFVLMYVDPNAIPPVEEVPPVEPDDQSIVVSVKKNHVKVHSSAGLLEEINIFNLSGTLIYQQKNTNSHEFNERISNTDNQLLIIKITLKNGDIITKKVVY